MAILIDETKKVLIQGITGREGRARAKLMMGYGTNVVAGCTPGKCGMEVHGVPVFDTVEEAFEKAGDIDVSVIFVPAPLVKDAAMESFNAGIKLVVIVPDRVPLYDVMEIAREAKKHNAKFVGPNTLGILSPGKGVLGMIGGRSESARKWFKPGPVGISSRSGGITSSLAYYMNKVGVGQTTMVHVGGDSIVGLPHPEVMKLFEKDPDTKLVVMFGEIGGSQEETVAELIEKGEFTKPLVAFIGGKAAKEGTRFSHAGAIVEGNRGTHHGKVKKLREVGATVVDDFDEIPKVVRQKLIEMGLIGEE
ncbi:MAG: succinate--CoA ligase subunit alpha [Candidatus Eremiobacteraeota bacterium]|nr:succinate--CoA ligase subunit alpha [Candidatus Eremiobacteraeota bacterium]